MNQEYFGFIESCRKKNPIKFHKHHIIPRYMGGTNDPENLIKLSYEDHFNSHVLLAESFKEGSDDYNRNMWAASRLMGWINDSSQFDISEKLSNIRKGKTYEELFGEETSKIAKEKISINITTWWNNLSTEEYTNLILKMKNGQENFWVSASDEYRKEISVRNSMYKKEWWNTITDTQLNGYLAKRSEISKIWWSSLSDNEILELKSKWSDATKNWWITSSDEKIRIRNKKISISQKGKTIKPETTEKWKKTIDENGSLKGDKNPMYGKHHSEETKKMLSEKKKGISINIKPRAIFKFFKDGVFIYEAIGQNDARNFCKEQNISFQVLCKKSDRWNNWHCKRNKK
jgi:hypothetical protein